MKSECHPSGGELDLSLRPQSFSCLLTFAECHVWRRKKKSESGGGPQPPISAGSSALNLGDGPCNPVDAGLSARMHETRNISPRKSTEHWQRRKRDDVLASDPIIIPFLLLHTLHRRYQTPCDLGHPSSRKDPAWNAKVVIAVAASSRTNEDPGPPPPPPTTLSSGSETPARDVGEPILDCLAFPKSTTHVLTHAKS